jgi:hypothetical protein
VVPLTPQTVQINTEMEYDTCMPERVGVRVRRLPDGEFCNAFQTSSGDRFFELDVTGDGLPLGSLLEIESGSALYWGEVRQQAGSLALVWIEHSLDKSKLQPIRESWGE